MNRGIGLLVIATILWAGNYICGRYLGPALPPTFLNTMRWAISTVILIGILFLNKKKLPVFNLWKEFIILGFTGIFAFSTLTYLALTNISASQAGMISAGIPIAILFFTPIILKEKIGVNAWVGAVISIIGVFLLFQGRLEEGSSPNTLIGNIQVVLACLAWGLYTVLGKRYSKQADSLTLTAGAALFGTVFSAISCIGTVDVESIHMTGTAWLCLLYVSTFASVGAFLAWNVGVKIVGAGKSAPYLNLLPVWTVVFGLLLLNEEMSFLSWVGGTITIIGAVIASIIGKVSAKSKLGADASFNG
ncbi:DMT family transporter [Bacillus litorisediminis]|uniref:DMT family transporter n=1 Tax=Bacillus litorisediminis TaxID=2922713 RepID=UPI001FAF91FD|nr:DMT family transporter [Bacillus litorisediminis]